MRLNLKEKYQDKFPFLKEMESFEISPDIDSIRFRVISGEITVEQMIEEIENDIELLLTKMQERSDVGAGPYFGFQVVEEL